ncbi:hypothetical protein HNR19_004096 [Nocardioides thalensis]|uniref:Uncharacterized protein n=1 Tax=Nocardioides thalensis TaxID=1914755 RepID=A0A853CAD8_9ACTN|nr:hypothetical protein [Nocardioides thalensis]NYJ03398.1 hypothetical protein [Nocardioides thalensis]
MTDQRPDERFRTLPAPVAPESLRAVHDTEPAHEELLDAYREQTWLINNVG